MPSSARCSSIPTAAQAYAQHGLVLTSVGRSEDAVAAFDRAIRLNPSADTVGVHLFHRARALLYLGRYDEAITSLERGMAFTPEWTDYMLLAAAYAMKGDAARAPEPRRTSCCAANRASRSSGCSTRGRR